MQGENKPRTGPALLAAAAILIVAGAALVLLRSGTGTTGDEARHAAAPEASDSAARIAGLRGDGARASGDDGLFFLPETGALAPADRPLHGYRPDANGNHRILNGRAITSLDDGEFMMPRWSPDGLEILMTRPGFNGLFIVGADGGPIAMVTDRENVGFRADWGETGEIGTVTPDGDAQRFSADGTPAEDINPHDRSSERIYTENDTVYYRENPGDPARPVSGGSDRYYGGEVSPCGKYIVYSGLETGLHIKALDGSSLVRLGEGYRPQWLADSSGIVYFITTDDGHDVLASDLYLASIDGKTVSNLTNTPNQIERNPSVSPDGTSIVYEVDGVIHVGQIH